MHAERATPCGLACLVKVQEAVLEGVREHGGALADGHVVPDLQQVPVADVQRVNERIGANLRTLHTRFGVSPALDSHAIRVNGMCLWSTTGKSIRGGDKETIACSVLCVFLLRIDVTAQGAPGHGTSKPGMLCHGAGRQKSPPSYLPCG